MVNQFYVDPASDISGGLMGLGNVIKDYRLEQEQRGKIKAAQERMAEVQSAMSEAFNSGDANKVAEIAIKYPEAQKTVEMLYGFKSDQTKRNMLDTYRAILSNKGDPNAALGALNSRAEYLDKEGADSTQTRAAIDELQSAISRGEDVSGLFKDAEMRYAALASPQEWKAYSGEAEGQKTPSSVLETEWFLRQPKDVQDEHLKLKRKTDPTMAEKLAYAQDIANIKVSEEAGKVGAKERIMAASEVADKVINLENGLRVYDNLITEIDNGANTSVFTSWAPTIQDATRRFEQGARELGLGVISNTTFGALSEGELRLAMETAVPKLQPAAMRQWLLDKKAAQQKLADEMLKYADHLEQGGSKVSWIKAQKALKKSGGSGEGSMTPGITEKTGAQEPSIDDLLEMY